MRERGLAFLRNEAEFEEMHKGIASCNSVACHCVWGAYYIMRHMELWFMHAWATGNDAFAVQRTIQFKGNSKSPIVPLQAVLHSLFFSGARTLNPLFAAC